MYYLYSVKNQGWVSLYGNYTSDLTEAATFTYEKAMYKAKVSKTEHTLLFIPISVTLVEEL